MTVDEPRRHALYTKLEEVLGADEAETFMQLTPPTDALRVGLEARMDRLEAELRGEIQSLRAEMHGEIGGLGGELSAEMQRLFRIQTIWLIGVILTFTSVITAASRLL